MRCPTIADTTTNFTDLTTSKYVALHAQDLYVAVSNTINCDIYFLMEEDLREATQNINSANIVFICTPNCHHNILHKLPNIDQSILCFGLTCTYLIVVLSGSTILGRSSDLF